ncbi:hypothetical protein [Luteibacter sp.]|uniref:hypothetical protein n=1 Tax=Luteibacter sp. TaxID=1886636 RepID=UPI003F7EA014
MTERLLIVAMVLCSAMGAGSVAWRAIAALTGGAWGACFHDAWRRMAWLLIPAAALAAACLACSGGFFPEQAHVSLIWLIGRTAGVFVVWGIGAVFAFRMAGPVLVAWALACLLFATDWIVAPQTPWSSTVIGMALATGQLASAFALAVASSLPPPRLCERQRTTDAAGLMVCLALGWAYLAGVDYLAAWVADLPDEARWYLPRTRGAWVTLIIAAFVLHVIVPVLAVLPARWRINATGLRLAATSMWLGQACHVAWMVLP